MWITTGEGLAVYDGNDFIVLTRDHGFPIDVLTAIEPEKSDPLSLWIGTNGAGLCRYMDNKVEVFNLDSNDNSRYITSLCQDPDNVLWIGTSSGIFRRENEKIQRYNVPGDSNGVSAIINTGNSLLFCFQRSITILNRDGRFHEIFPNLETGEVISGVIYNDDSFVLSTTYGYLIKVSSEGITDYKIKISRGILHEIIEDQNGYYWIAGTDGLFRIRKNVFTGNESSGQSVKLFDGIVHSIYLDKDNNLWIGTFEKGLYKIDEKGLIRFQIAEVKPGYHYVPAAVINQRIWYIDGNEISETFIDSNSNPVNFRHSTGRKRIINLSAGADNTLWAGCNDGEILVFNPVSVKDAKSKLKYLRSLLPGRELPQEKWMFFIPSDSSLWLSYSQKGITVLNLSSGKIEHELTESDGLPSRDVRKIITQGDLVWFGGVKGGISVFTIKDNTFRFKFNIKGDDIRLDAIRELFCDSKGRIWIGTRHGGVIIRDDNGSKILTTADGLISNAVWSIDEDKNGNIWLGLSRGVQCLDPINFKVLKTILEPDGKSIMKVGFLDNYLWGWQNESFIYYDLNEYSKARSSPVTFIRKVSINGMPQSESNSYNLNFNENNITFNFASVCFENNDEIKYRYRLLGAVENWSAAANDQQVSFAGLSPGSYIFEVQALNGTDTHPGITATVDFSISRPWWLTWWFRIGFLILLAGIGYTFHRIRVNRLLEVERTRLRIARDLHDEIGGTLSSITYFSKALEKDADIMGVQISRFVKLITDSSLNARSSLSDIIWAIDPSNDSWESLSSKIRRFTADALESKCIRYEIDIVDSLRGNNLDMNKRRHLWLLYKEALNNTLKHSGCSLVNISLRLKEKSLELIIEDNGVGFDISAPSEGNGIRNIKSRGKLLGAEVKLVSEPGKGTRWEIIFNI